MPQDKPITAKVAIVGAGLVGRAWAIVFSRAGYAVRMTDTNAAALDAAIVAVRAGLNELAAHGLASDPAAAARVQASPDLASAVKDVHLIQENGPETVEFKAEIFAQLDRLAPRDAILATSSSSIAVSRFADGLAGRSRCLVGHPVNPPHLVPLVEICGATWTDPAVIQRARDLYDSAGQVPVILNKEVEGFALNRLQGALLSEALRLVEDGVISPQDLDKTVRDGLGPRWSFMGPFETVELNAPGGMTDYFQRYGGFYQRIADDIPAESVWNTDKLRVVAQAWGPPPSAEQRAERSAWRDRRLAALMAHRKAMER
jgi:3-hydroxyacyl-CoA dehydrogenase